MGDGGVGNGGESVNQSHVLFDRFVQATTCKGTLRSFQELCDFLELKPSEYRIFYHKLKSRLNYWKAKALWAKLDKRASHKDYKKGRACTNSRCLIIGAGPCGLRTAIELSFLGAKVVLLEKRDAFSRNNVLHLWPFTIQDLRGLGAKKFYGKFCAGAIDHISIRQLQLILLKVALLLGIEIHVNVEFKGLVEPPEDQENERIGWRAEVSPGTHPVNELEFDVVIGADGRRNTLPGFRRKEFRGKLAIAITANFINRNTTAEAKVEEISGVAFIFNQKFFQDLREATGIDLENIVYYKDDTHYFVMTAKKQSLLEKGVILHDHADTELLLSRGNVDQAALLAYAREAADFSTNHQLPTLDFAINHYGQPDVAMFDFTCMYASENAALVRQRNGHQLLVALVGDSLLEPFWPMGTGIARGFLAALDSAWMVRSWSQGTAPLEVLAERETIYRLLPQTTPENVSKNFSQYSVDPTTRYPNINLHSLRPNQVRHLIDTGECRDPRIDMENAVNALTPKLTRHEYGQLENILEDSIARSSKLLSWCQRQTQGYRNVSVTDLTTSWKSGLALCAIIHRYRPDLIDFDSLEERDLEKNNQLAFDVAEQEFGISPIMTGKEMSSVGEPDKLSMVMYLSQFYEMFKDTVPPGDNNNLSPEDKAALIASTKSPISFLSKLGQSITRKRNPKDQKEKELEGKRRRTSLTEDEGFPRVRCEDRHGLATALTERRVDAVAGGNNNNKVKSMASQLLAKFEENAPVPSSGLKRQARSCSSSRSCPKKIILLSSSSSTSSSPSLHAQCSLRKEFPQNIGGSDVCYFCHRRVYVMERLSAEGKFFHRSCFKCDYCGTTLRLSSYAFDLEDGKFYCKPHYCYRLSGQAQRKRPAPTAPLITKENKVTPSAPNAVDSTGRAMATVSPGELRPPVAEVNGVLEACLAKRPRGTPERIELENYRLSLQREEELEEVPEETLAEHNLSSALDKVTDAEEASSSESEMEGEEEEEEEPEQHGQHPGARGSKRAAWEETPQPEENLAEVGPPDMGEAGPKGDREEEEQDEEEEEDIEEESSDEGEYCPWEMELHSGLWLESLVDEEDTGTFKARNLRIQQALQPVDPLADAHPGPVQAEGPQGGASAKASGPSLCTVPAPPSARHEIVRAWLDSLPGDAYEDALEEEAKSMDADEGPDVFEDDIPSDAEAEARLHQLEAGDPLQEDEEKSVSHGRVSSLVQSSIGPIQMDGDDVVVESQLETIQEFQSPYSLATSSMHFFPEPYVEDTTKPDVYVPDTSAKQSPVAPGSPIHSQLEPLPDAVTTKSPTKQFFACSPAGNPLSPICTQPLPVDESVRTQSEDSPVRTQPVPTIASTPLPSSPKEKAQEPSLPNTTTSPVKRSDIIEEFWMKSAEIRKSLGLTPLERSSGPQKRFSVPFDLLSSRLHTPDEVPDESKPLFSSCSPIHRLNITVEGRVVSPVDKEPKTIGSVKRALSSSSGLGLNGSPTTSQTLNTSDSAMLTPPSSPPPPPPNEEPATLRHKKHQVGWNNPSEPAEPITRSPQTPGPSPGPDKPPVPSPTHENFKPTAMLVPALRTKPISAVVRRENTKRKSFVESVEEIPFADDVEDQSDARTPNTSQKEKFYTPPTSRPQKERPPMNLALGVENGTPKRHRDISEFSPEAKGIAEERMRAREKNIKSQALKDAMAMHLTKMKEMDAPNASSKAAWNVSSDSEGKTEYTSVVLSPPNVLEAKVLDSQRFADTLPARLPSNSGNQTQDGNQSVEGSAASSESSAGGKIKKRSSIFSPRKSKKEKKAKSEGRSPDKHSQEDLPKHKSIWKTVFSGYKKEKRKKDDKSLPSTPSSASAVDSEKKRTSPLNRASDVQLRRNLSFSEDSDLSCDDVLEKSSQRSKADSVNVPHALALKRGYAIKRTYTEEELNAKLTRRVQKAARRQAKQEELKRLHRAQIIQRQLEQVEEKQRQLEERGVAVEKALRGEAGMCRWSYVSPKQHKRRSDYWGESNYSEILDLHLGVEPPLRIPRRRPFSFCPCCVTEGMGKKDDPRLMQEWFKLVQEKNALVRYESELMIFARELELEDRQSRLQQELRERMAVDDHLKSEEELLEERQILNEMLEVVEQRDSLVALLEEQRLREKEEDRDLEAVMLSKGFNLNWA
ncbi:protein-methionine sulfoxide oxidase mical3a-like isoform X22 [Brienomyrus brachyistius]|uniref:protein-methionine sulfoxide oxidase mical3a-like isoform X22 n=1 Tax=Brienomyrus brachyistius TaxID=42636 RepID=UPI0020B1DC36|nr:protein-methionine sulfoxide oxidase mical3a-like isoform X22 [Brienomyrus brachyistius]